jgi:hypothetical protein
MKPGPKDLPSTDDEYAALIRPLWLKTKPSKEAQAIRGAISTAVDDPRCAQWALDYTPDYVWDLIDIAAQRGIELGMKMK